MVAEEAAITCGEEFARWCGEPETFVAESDGLSVIQVITIFCIYDWGFG